MCKSLPGAAGSGARVIAGILFAVALQSPASAQVTFEWARVGHANNPPDTEVMICCDEAIGTTGFGSVDHVYDFATTEVTNAQYAEFLNAIDPTGANALAAYPPEMATEAWAGIDLVLTNPEGSRYVPDPARVNWPAIPVTFWGAVRFVNWLHNGQGNGDVQTGAYTLTGPGGFPSNANTVVRNPGARYFLPTENEWYKAAYYDGATDTYYDYPDGNDTQTVCATPSATPGTANCDFSVLEPVDVGSYTGETGIYGIYDMSGNALEWTETIADVGQREARGGSWSKGVDFNASSFTYSGLHTTAQEPSLGFRVARPLCPDSDGDGVLDCFDNCIYEFNPAQDDTDGDDCGNVCDPSYDGDSTVTFADFGAFSAAYLTNNLDFDHTEPVTGPVAVGDFFVFSSRYGLTSGPSGTTTGTAQCPGPPPAP